jgi:predicted RNA-binding protein with PIN domain
MKQMPALCDRTLEDGRKGLVRFIREHRPQGSDRNAVTVVFDGQDGIVASDVPMDQVIRVIFTRGTSADDHIRELLEAASDPRQIICVTNDRDLGLSCRHRGAVVWSVDQFVGSARKDAARKPGPARRGSLEADVKRITDRDRNMIDQEFSALWLGKKGL